MVESLINKYRSILPIFCCLTAYALFNLSDAVVKSLGADMHISQMVCSFFIVQLIFASVMGWRKDGIRAFVPKRKVMYLRVLLVHIIIACNVTALTKVELTTFYTLIFTTPLWVALLSSYILKDKLGVRRLSVILVGFAAIVFAMNPFGGNVMNIWSFVLLTSAFLGATDLIILRRIGPSESKWFLVTSVSAAGILLHGPVFYLNYTPLALTTWLVMAVMGCFQVGSFFILLYGYQNASSASVVAPLHYSQMLWGVLIGYFVFSEIPTLTVMIGATVIVLSGIYLIFCEKNFQHEEKVSELSEVEVNTTVYE